MNARTYMGRIASLTLSALFACTTALAGGPLRIYDPSTKTPNAWPAGDTPVYLDMGALGQLNNAQAGAMVDFAVSQWNDVPTSSFHGVVAGDFASIGLPDINASNIFNRTNRGAPIGNMSSPFFLESPSGSNTFFFGPGGGSGGNRTITLRIRLGF